MDFTITPQNIITAGAVITAIGTILGVVYKLHKAMDRHERFIERHEKSEQELKIVKQEQELMFSALCACLDGLEQLGANHTVPITKARLENWLNKRAHED